MKIIVAPSKTQKIRRLDEFCDCDLQVPDQHLDLMKKQTRKTNKLVKTLNSHTSETIAKKMKLKGQLLDDVLYNFKNFKKTEDGHGILSYTGTVFKELKVEEYTSEEFDYVNQHVIILSALYGPLPAFYLIKPYRLDMTMTLFEQNLYKEWKADCNRWFKNEDLIIDLSSKEFSKLVDGHKLTFEFLQNVKGAYKTVAYHSKQARGFMLNYLITNHVEDKATIKAFNIEGYVFDDDLSSEMHYVFKRN